MGKAPIQETEPGVCAEDESQRGMFEKHFLLSDGSFVVVDYAEAVHYQDKDNVWREVDNTLSVKNRRTNRIENSCESFKVSFANTGADDDLVILENDNHQLSWSFGFKCANEDNTVSKKASYKTELPTEHRKENDKKTLIGSKISAVDSFSSDKMYGKIRYSSIIEEMPELSVDYTVFYNKIEEDIYINNPTDMETLVFVFKSGDLNAVVNEDNSVIFLDKDGKLMYKIGVPYMEDAAGSVLNHIVVAAEKKDDNTFIKYTPDKDWFTSKERVYPILLDPSITTGEYRSNITDTYVCEGNTENHSSEQKLYFGVKNGKVHRSYIKINNLPTIDAGMPVISATLQLTNTIGSTTGKKAQIYRVSKSWNPATITFANQPGVISDNLLDTFFFNSQKPYTFNVSKEIIKQYSGGYAQYGFMVKYEDETLNSPDYNAVYSSEYTAEAYRPLLTIRYGYILPSNLSSGSAYNIKNVGSQSFMTVHNGTDVNGTNVYQTNVTAGTLYPKYMFRIETATSNDGYYIKPVCCASGNGRVLDIAKENGYIQNGSNVRIYDKSDAASQQWFFVGVCQNEFKIISRSNMSLALTAQHSSQNGNSSGTSSSSAGNIYVSNYSNSDKYQRWYFVKGDGSYVNTDTQLLKNGTYYINNLSTGRFIGRNGTVTRMVSGITSTLGTNIRWKIKWLGADKYTIQSLEDTSKYLYVTSGTMVSVGTPPQTDNIPDTYVWVITSVPGGFLVKNKLTDKYIKCIGSSLKLNSAPGTPGTDSYNQSVWRVVSTDAYGNTASSSTGKELKNSSSFNQIAVGVGESVLPSINKNPIDSMWSEARDFTYTIMSGNTDAITVDQVTGTIKGKKVGVATCKARHKVTGYEFTFKVYVDPYTKILVDFFKFTDTEAVLIRRVYDAVDAAFPGESRLEREWKAARLLSTFRYDRGTGDKWNLTAGMVVNTKKEKLKDYFMSKLGFSEGDYDTLKKSIDSNKQVADSQHTVSDFAHMQYSLAARLAYKLDKSSIIAVGGAVVSTGQLTKLDLSYLAGWLGDAVLSETTGTLFKNDDYYADLDAENIYNLILNGYSAANAYKHYYNNILKTKSRADCFLEHITYERIKNYIMYSLIDYPLDLMIAQLSRQASSNPYYSNVVDSQILLLQINRNSEAYHWDTLKTGYPDTYNFLKSLEDRRQEMHTY